MVFKIIAMERITEKKEVYGSSDYNTAKQIYEFLLNKYPYGYVINIEEEW